MMSLEDQLADLGLSRQDRPHAASAYNENQQARRKKNSADDAVRELPIIGTVSRTEEGRGFGFIKRPGHEDIFFHVKGYAFRRGQPPALPAPGTRILFILGSDPRHGQRRGVVRWIPVTDVPSLVALELTTQADLDALRRTELSVLDWTSLWRLLRADWYRTHWGNNAPADLVDPVLEEVWRARVHELSPNDLAGRKFWETLSRSQYEFAISLTPHNLHRALDLMLFELPQLVALGAPKADWMLNADRELQVCLKEWHLVTRGAGEATEGLDRWFTGNDPSEVALARRVIDAGLELDAFGVRWITTLADNGLLEKSILDVWATRTPRLSLDLFEHLSSKVQAKQLAQWRKAPDTFLALQPEPARISLLLSHLVLSLDLETDGDRVWEVGCAQAGQASLLFSEGQNTTLPTALSQVTSKVLTAAAVIGHNLVSWDWPIIQRLTSSQKTPAIWDTLLVEFLLHPQAASHALGGSHRADGDAAAALELFNSQLARLPADFARRVLLGEFNDAAEIIEAIAHTLEGDDSYSRDAPAIMGQKTEVGRVLLMPAERIREYDWVPDSIVVSVDAAAGLPFELCQIDASQLEETLQARAPLSPAAVTVLAVARRAAKQGISLRRNMIPIWLTDGDDVLTQALDSSCLSPVEGQGFRIAPLPRNLDWWRGADMDKFQLVERDRVILFPGQTADFLGDAGTLLRDWSTTSLSRTANEGNAAHWVIPDRAAHFLDAKGGTLPFTTWALPDRAHLGSIAGLDVPVVRPVLVTRRNHVLYPHSRDQAAYWQEVLRTLREVVGAQQGNTSILLIGSSENAELVKLLEIGLAELGLGEVRPAHRSRGEHLRRAARKGYSVVDVVANWPMWRSIGESLSTSLQPVIEALPIEHWYACEQARREHALTEHSAELSDDDAEMHGAPEHTGPVAIADILQELPSLVSNCLPALLSRLGLGSSGPPAVLIDPRLALNASALRRQVEVLPLQELPLSPTEKTKLDIALAPFKLEREEAPADFASMERFLIQHWQSSGSIPDQRAPGFKASQRAPMEAICDRSSHVLVSLPTGEGKSVLFQVPALCRGLRNRRLTLVISPLKALMRDQVEGLRERGFAVSADYLSSDLTPYESSEVMQGVLDHRIVLLYVAPERMRSPTFLAALDKRMQADDGLEYVVVDEAHCVNQWGYEFRPDYFHATQLLLRKCRDWQRDSATPFLLMSATITKVDEAKLETFLASVEDVERPPLKMLALPEGFANPIRSHIEILPQRVWGRVGGEDLEAALAARLPVIVQAISQARANQLKTRQRSAGIVFVQSRALAERVAEQLIEETGARVAFYHAGLDAAIREEVYSDFRQEELDVLVATKAFGMGMDIPDIHWAVHLSPSANLEDYLQEVGRIGRGAAEREKAELKTLSAVLPYSNEDFAQIRDLRARNTLRRQDIDKVLRDIRSHSIDEAGLLVSVVPAHGYDQVENDAQLRAATTRMRMALYWLERSGQLKLCSSLPDVMSVTLQPQILRRLVGEPGAVGELAAILLHLEGAGESRDIDASNAQGWLKRLLQGLADRVGLTFAGSSVGKMNERMAGAGSDVPVEALINLSQIRVRSKTMKSNDDVLAGLADLDKRGGLSMQREIEFSLRRLASSSDAHITNLFRIVSHAADEIIRQLAARGRVQLDPLELTDVSTLIGPSAADGNEENGSSEANKIEERHRELSKSAYIGGLRSLIRACGIRYRQVILPDDTVVWEAKLAPSECGNAAARRKVYVKSAQSLLAVIKSSQDRVAISTLINRVRAASVNDQFREQDLKRTAGLLSALKLVGMSIDLMQVSHVVVLDDQGENDQATDVWEDLSEVNELAEARNLAMEIFANLRPDAQAAFIGGYFAQSNSAQLKDFLETQLGEIEEAEDDQGSTVLSQMREQLRATRVVELLNRFRHSEEPAQWDAVCHPFDQHLLVNAGPGAGKTSVLVGRIVHLIREQHIHPSQIVVLAFNRAVVFEIRRRIREIFQSLGYAAYASRLRVSTLHSFAMRHLNGEGRADQKIDMEHVLRDFARRMEGDQAFRRKVAGDVRCILVDEFQDVTEEIYSVLRNLHVGSGARAGVMVIGDDDQDILRWQRSSGEFSEKYFDRFAHDFGGEELKQLLLQVNFRSARHIVARSQEMISGFFAGNVRSRRLKSSLLAARCDASHETRGERFNWKGRSLEEAIAEVPAIWRRTSAQNGETLAILCRSNAEVAQAHRLLEPHVPDISVQGSANIRTASLRHQALWLDFLRAELEDRDSTLSADLKVRLLADFRSRANIPELDAPDHAIDSIGSLWDLCCQEKAFPRVSTLIRFIEVMRSDDLVRLSGGRADSPSVTISTIHKVKGLEFDNVIVLPSGIQFGSRNGRAAMDIAGDAAEEARLLYVAMTRAKRGLWYFVGDRELCWGQQPPTSFEAEQRHALVLVGLPEEVGLGWAMQLNYFNPDPPSCQAYIERSVRVGDPITLGGRGSGVGKSLLHRNQSGDFRQIGFIANKYGSGTIDADLKVSGVIRFHPDKPESEGARKPEELQRWGYAVLVSGRLR